jgi:1,4-dihydroxy-2-naphthoate octaprenyltransferase
MAPATTAPALRARLRWLSTRLRAVRAFSFPLSVLPVIVSTAAMGPMARPRHDVLLASALAVLLLHAAGNLLNDYFDFRSGVDSKVDDDHGRPGRLLVRGEMTPPQVLHEAVACLILAAPAAGYLLARCGPGLLWFGGAALAGLYAYTGPPLRLKYRALGEPLIFLVFGPLLVTGAAYAQAGRWSWTALLLSVPVGMLTTGVLLGNNIRDLDEDCAAGVKTLACKLGLKAARLVYAFCVLAPALAVAGLVAAGVLGTAALLCLVALVPGWCLVRQALRTARTPQIDARTAQCAALFLVMLWLGMAIA